LCSVLVACGGGGGGGGSSSPNPAYVTGGVFNSNDNAATVYVAPGVIPESVEATKPTLETVIDLPAGLLIDTTGGDVNITKGVNGYTFSLSGKEGFITTADNAVVMSFLLMLFVLLILLLFPALLFL
jgi:hypothetical protein